MIAPHVSRRSLAVYLAGLFALAAFAVASVKVNLFAATKEYRVVGTYWASGDAANHHQNPYAVHPLTAYFYDIDGHAVPDLNLNPPLLLLLFQPMALLSPTSAFFIWTLVSFLLFIGTSAFLLWDNPNMSDACIVLMMVGAPILDTLMLAQLYVLLYVLGAVAWWGLQNKRNLAAGVAIGILVAIKPIFILWPVFLFLSGKRKLAAVSSTVALVASAVPLAFYGYQVFFQWLTAVRDDQHYSEAFDVSIPAFARRLGHGTLGEVIAGALLVALIIHAIRAKPNVLNASGIALSASLLCSPLAWSQYALLLFPVLVTAPEHRLKKTLVIILSVPTYFPELVASAPDHRKILGQLFFFAPWWLFLGFFLLKDFELKRSSEPIPARIPANTCPTAF